MTETSPDLPHREVSHTTTIYNGGKDFFSCTSVYTVIWSNPKFSSYETQTYLFSMAVLTTSTQHPTAVGKTEKREVL
jgi:hypothetical protein